MSTSSASSDLEFGGRVTLEDGFSGVADRVSRRFRALRADFSAGIANMDGALGKLRAGAARIPGVVSSVSGALDRVLGPLGSVAAGAARFLAIPLLYGIFAIGRAAIRSSSEMENLRIAFTTMMHGAEAANEHLLMLQRFAVGKPFEFRDLVVASRNLQTFGFQAAEVRGLLQDFGDAAFNAGTGVRGMNAMVNVFGTILATNKVTFGQLRMLVRAGVPAFQILRDELHLTDDQLRKIAKSGIQGRTVIDALRRGMQQRFTGGMERAAQTISARISDLHDIAGIFLSQVGDELRPTILGFLNDFGRGIARLDWTSWAQRVAGALSTLFRIVRAGASIVVGAVTDLPGQTSGGLMRFLGNVRDVVQGVEALLSSESGGMGRIPRRLQATLMKNGLWPLALRIAQWGDRVRNFLRGFIEGVGREFSRAGGRLRWLADAFGLTGDRMGTSSAQARTAGASLASLLARAVELRVSLAGLSAGIQAATLAQRAFNFAMALNPLTLAVVGMLALAALHTYVLARNWDRLAAAAQRFAPYLKTLAVMALPVTAIAVAFLAVPVAIAYTITHWELLKKSFTGGGKEINATLDRWSERLQLVRDAFRVVWAIVSTEGRSAFASVRPDIDAFFARLDGGAVNARLGPLRLAFTGFRKWVSGEMKLLSGAVSAVFAAMVASITGSLRGLAGDLVAAFRALPPSLRPAGLGGAVERLDAFARGPQQPEPTAQPGAAQTPAATPQTPAQAVVQRTQAQARVAGAAPVVVPAPHVVVQPAPTVVQIDGREVARTVARHHENENIRGGGNGSQD